MKEENPGPAAGQNLDNTSALAAKRQRVMRFMERLQQTLDVPALKQVNSDAEERNRPSCITYRRAWGATFRKYCEEAGAAPQHRFATVVSVLVLYYLAGAVGSNYWHSHLLASAYFAGAWLITVLATFYLPDDKIYLDRLNIIVPDHNLIVMTPKVLWSRLEEVAIVDLAGKGKPSRFAIQLTQVGKEECHIFLDLLEKEELSTLVDYMQRYAPHARGLAQLSEIEKFYDYQTGKLEHISYTQLWESSCRAQFGLTSFTPLAAKQKVQERYTVIKQIAAGGFSAIYLIADGDGQHFVLKESVLPPTLDAPSRSKASEQFQREATILAKLNHPQIATVYDYFVENGRNYLRLEYVEGTNMRQYVKDNGGQSEAVVENWTEQLAQILIYLHELTPPVVHRDLSPDNVVVRPDGRLVLIDFGAANEFIGAATGTLVGKHAYMAPEQIRGNAEPASDIYSLGALAYFALSGRDPEPIASASAKGDGAKISDWFDDFIRLATQIDRDERFPAAATCLAYLRKSSALAASPPENGGTHSNPHQGSESPQASASETGPS